MTLVMIKSTNRTNPVTPKFRTTRMRLDRQGAMNRLWRHYIVEERPCARNPSTGLPSIMTLAGFKSPLALLAAEGMLTPTNLRRFGLTRNSMAAGGAREVMKTLDTNGTLPKFLGVDVVSDLDCHFLSEVQDAHDWAVDTEYLGGAEFIASMQTNLKNICKDFDMTVPTNKPKSMAKIQPKAATKVKSTKPKAATKIKAVKAKSTKRKGAK